jgi:hypothetical protein
MVASTILRNLRDEVHRSLAWIMREGDCDVVVGAMVLRKAAEFVANSASNDSAGKHNGGYEIIVSVVKVGCESVKEV